MRPEVRRFAAPALLALAFGVAGGASGCGHRIGDSCTINTDCSALGDRYCDIASSGGYCTIEGCDIRLNSQNQLVDSCQNVANESVCVRFFTLSPAKSKECDPTRPELICNPDERCLCDVVAMPDLGVVQPLACAGNAHCAKESTERRWCMLKCNQTSDCRTGYQCLAPGTAGSEPVPSQLIKVYTDAGTSSDEGGPFELVATGNYTQKFCIYQGTPDGGS